MSIIKEILRKQYKKEITIEQAIKLALSIFKQVLENEFDIQRFNIAYIKNTDERLTKLKGDELMKFK